MVFQSSTADMFTRNLLRASLVIGTALLAMRAPFFGSALGAGAILGYSLQFTSANDNTNDDNQMLL